MNKVKLKIVFFGLLLTPTIFYSKEKNSVVFTENKGQIHDQNYNVRPDILYGAMAGNMAVHIKNTGISYQLYSNDSRKYGDNLYSKERKKKIYQQTIYRIDLCWLNANTNFTKTQDEELPGYNNYYLENCPNGVLNVKSYKGIILHNLYNGINLHYYEKDGDLKHDYIVAPNADYKQIKLMVKGSEVSINKDGTLILTTPLGKIQEGAPICYQNGKQLKANWVLRNNILSFNVENYSPNYELIIDPITRLWGTYYGGSGDDRSQSCATDASNNVYIAGYTNLGSGTIIATVGSHQTVFNGNNDAYLCKYNSMGVRQWATYYGGSGNDIAYSCATDVSGNTYFAGLTTSFPGTVIATVGSHQPSHGGGTEDGFLVKFNSSGVRTWGTYYGGSANDNARACATDPSGNVYLAGMSISNSGTNIASPGSHQTTHGGSTNDAFLAKFNSSGVRQWGTYYGGTSNDFGMSCSADASGNSYLAGYAFSTNNISTPGGHQTSFGGSYLVKFNSVGVRQWGTYYGGTSSVDRGNSCATDASGNIYLAGTTDASTSSLIATPGAHQTTIGAALYEDAYLVKFNTNGIRQWGTYYGGNLSDFGNTCSVDAIGNVYLGGTASSSVGTSISTNGSHQTIYGGGSNDAFLVKFNAAGVREAATYYGGNANDSGNGCAIDANSNAYLTGSTSSSVATSIASLASHQTSFGGITDGYLVKLQGCVSLSPVAAVNSTVCVGASLNFSASVTGSSTPSYSWTGPSNYTSSVQNPILTNATLTNSGIYTLTVNNGGCIETASTNVTVNSNPTVTAVSSQTNFLCIGQSATLTANGASNYLWNTTATTPMLIVSPTTSTNYTVTGTDLNGCSSTAVISQSVSACTGIGNIGGETQLSISVKAYPNPTNALLLLESNTKSFFEITDAMGRVIKKGSLLEGNNQLFLADFSEGIYFLKVSTGQNRTQNIKIIKSN